MATLHVLAVKGPELRTRGFSGNVFFGFLVYKTRLTIAVSQGGHAH